MARGCFRRKAAGEGVLQNESDGNPQPRLPPVGAYNAGAGVGASALSNDALDERADALLRPCHLAHDGDHRRRQSVHEHRHTKVQIAGHYVENLAGHGVAALGQR